MAWELFTGDGLAIPLMLNLFLWRAWTHHLLTLL